MLSVLPPSADGGIPPSAELAGLGSRFHYWRGRSGRRYLFTEVGSEQLADFGDAVVVIAETDARGRLTGKAVGLLGCNRIEVEGLAAELAARGGLVAFVHLLTATHAQRRAVLDDLAAHGQEIAA